MNKLFRLASFTGGANAFVVHKRHCGISVPVWCSFNVTSDLVDWRIFSFSSFGNVAFACFSFCVFPRCGVLERSSLTFFVEQTSLKRH